MSKSVRKRSKMKWKSSKSVVKWNEVKCREGGKNETSWDKFIWVVKWREVKGWGENVSTICVGKNIRNCTCIQYFLTLVLFTFCTCCILRCLVCIVVILSIFAVPCVYYCFLLQMPDFWLEVSTRKVLRLATSTQVFLVFLVSISKCWDGSQDSKLPLHASHVALPT